MSMRAEIVNGHARGITRIGPLKLDTTGVLGLSKNRGQLENRGFPSWMTIPSWRDLGSGRHWHFFFAWIFVISGFVYLVHGFMSEHFAKDLAPTKEELKPRHIWHEVIDHARLRFLRAKRRSATTRCKNSLMAALCLSCCDDGADGPYDVSRLRRRRADPARYIRRSPICADTALHLGVSDRWLCIRASGDGGAVGLINNVRSMITGRYEIERRERRHDHSSFPTRLLIGAAAALAGCDQLQRNQSVTDFIRIGESLSKGAQRVFLSEQPLAREFKVSDLSPTFRANGTTMPAGDDYAAHVRDGFRNWRLSIDGMVARPAAYSMDQLRAMTSRTQITRHDCVEGWSAIGQWTGVPLWSLLALAQIQPGARYVVFHCADKMYGDVVYYESIDLFDAVHPQTMLAYELNGKPLPVANGARCVCASNGNSATSRPSTCSARSGEQLAKFGGGRGGIGKIAATNGMAASKPEAPCWLCARRRSPSTPLRREVRRAGSTASA